MEEEKDGLLQIRDVGRKEKRADHDRKYKWPVDELREDFVEKVKELCRLAFGEAFETKMFGNDFRKHVECIQKFIELLKSGEDGNVDDLFSVMDLIFKWAFVKIVERSNTALEKEILTMIEELIEFLCQDDTGHQLWEFECAVLVPLLTERTGSNNSAIKDKAKSILKRMITQEKVIPHKDIFAFLMQGLSSKNTKTKSESMEEIHYFLTLYKTEFISDKETKAIIKLVENNDKALRNNTLNACAEIYRSTGEPFWKMADKLL